MRPNVEEIRWHVTMRNNDDPVCPMFTGQYVRDVGSLLVYIDELENMPLVQTVLKLQEENERLKAVRGADKDHCHHRYLLTEHCPYCEASRKMALRNERMREALKLFRNENNWYVRSHIDDDDYTWNRRGDPTEIAQKALEGDHS